MNFCKILPVDTAAAPSDRLPEFPLWNFSLTVYARPGVAAACIALQDDSGLDVNLLLLCVWVALEGPGTIEARVVQQCMAAVRPWRHDVVEPLRSMRRTLKLGVPAFSVAQVGTLRDQIAAAELAAEHIEQQVLAALLNAESVPVAHRDALAMADHNLRIYLECGGVAMTPAVRGHLDILLSAATGASLPDTPAGVSPV